MIISRTPFRVSFVGGGTDLPYFYREHDGCVVSMSINRYSFLTMHRSFERHGYLLKYSKSERVEHIDQIEHRIIRAVFERYGIDGVDFASASDVPAGTGLASSSAFAANLISLCDAYTGRSQSQLDIADGACDIELNVLKEPIGKQDQYGCAVGGLKKIEFHKDDTVTVEPILLTSKQRDRLESSIALIYCGGERSASSQLKIQQQNVASSAALIDNLKTMARQAHDLSVAIRRDVDLLGDYLHEGWERKKRLSASVSNPKIDAMYAIAREAGATGGKLLGAGESGFLLVHAPDRLDAVLDALSEHKIERIKLDLEGTKIVYNDLA
jgi:D-glycero-alpha-D-manno-heptose-7-phosphate kinase